MSNFFFIPQVSMRSYTSGKYSYLRSGYTQMYIGMINALFSYYNQSSNFLIACPPKFERDDEVDFLYSVTSPVRERINEFVYEFSINAAYNRFSFPMREILAHSDSLKDITTVFNSNIEQMRNWKFVFNYLNINPTLIGFIHYLDFTLHGSSQFLFRLIDGIDCCDRCFFFSEELYSTFFSYVEKYLTKVFILKLKNKSGIIQNMIFNETELLKNKSSFIKKDKKQIFFTSRCSDNERTHWIDFVQYMKKLYTERQDFEVFLANPSHQNKEVIEEHLQGANFISFASTPLTRQEYIQRLWTANIVPFLYETKKFPSIGIYEAAFCDNYVLELGHEFKTLDEFVDCVSWSLDNCDKIYPRKEFFIQTGSCEKNGKAFIELLKIGGIK